MAALLSHYEVLDAPTDADYDSLKASYRRLSVALHPDKGGDADAFRRIQAAWETLRDADARAAYDAANGIDDRDVLVWREAPVYEFARPAPGEPHALPCRCGGTYELLDDELDGVDLVPCDGCSCYVRVLGAGGSAVAADAAAPPSR